jgi:hypothetical protein
MPLRRIANTDACYYLIAFDENGKERREQDGSLLSAAVAGLICDHAENITDVFLASHGWKGDVPAAIEQYDRWVGEMNRSPDHQAAAAARPGFKALAVGIHWPSLPFGDENLTAGGGLLSGDIESDLENQIDQYAASICNSPTARAAIRTILEFAKDDDGDYESLPREVRNAYDMLFSEAFPGDLGGGSLGAPPGADHCDWDPNTIYQAARKAESGSADERESGLLGGGVLDRLKGFFVAPLQQMSFWKMKDRARRIGEGGGHALLLDLQRAAPKGTRFHLMGHSFGCIVVSSTIAGARGGPPLIRPVESLFLVQGALSLWAYCSEIPGTSGEAGYFSRILKDHLVRGPVVTTRSKFDRAVGRLYPSAVMPTGEYTLGEDFPKYGGIGIFGAQGLGNQAVDLVMFATGADYRFEKGLVYNLEASGVIKNGGGFSGAHSDIAHPEVAHAMWQAALSSM